MEKKAIELGAVALVLALLLRLSVADGDGRRELGNALIFLSTGRVAAAAEQIQDVPPAVQAEEPAATEDTGAAEEMETSLPEAAIPVFGRSQQSLVKINTAWTVDKLALLQEPLCWQLKGEQPTVLILHTHATESYRKQEGYQETSPYRTLDRDYNMVSVGARVAQLLEEGGIRVIHDTALHDSPSYNNAYSNARDAIRQTLEKNPGICLVLDLHRDAAQDDQGRQKAATVVIDGESTAQLMLVMGSDKGALEFPEWEKNLSLAVKLQAQLEQAYPGLCKPIKLVSYRYNQDLSTGALLVEVGMAGNTHREALAAAQLLAEGILALANGANLQY